MRFIAIARQLILAIPVILGTTLLAFLYLRVLPGDPVDVILGQSSGVSQQARQVLQQQLGLNHSIPVQLFDFASQLAHGNLGYSYVQHVSVTHLVATTLPATIELALSAMTFAAMVGLPLALLSSRRPLWNKLNALVSFLAVSMPEFWLGLVLVVVFSVKVHLLPSSGQLHPGMVLPRITGFDVVDALIEGNMPALISSLRHLVLPSIALGTPMIAVIARVLRENLSSELNKEYVRVARAKGLSVGQALRKHALRNALIPTFTVTGLNFGVLLGGNMVVETVFAWPGLGRLVVQAIFARDYPVVQGAIIVYALTFVMVNMLVDVMTTLLNPRVEF